jgi:hypothetical protein
MTGTATVRTLPALHAEPFSVADVLNMLTGAAEHWSSHRECCGDCCRSATGVCLTHDEDDRLAFLAGKLSRAFEIAGECALAHLLGLDRKAPVLRARIDVAAVSGEGEKTL